VALKGERFDAHDFVDQALQAGAAGVVSARGMATHGIAVPDTQAALEALGYAWRMRFVLPLIAVTGSNGKTTVTQMIASILRAWHGEGAFSTEGNFNNHIGVPLTLLRLRQDDARWHRAGVVELGMNHPGEIARLAALVQPTVALVNNAQREHQEFMASVEAVARENGSVFASLANAGTAVFPAADAHVDIWRELAGTHRVLTFGRRGDARADVRVSGVAATDGAHAWTITIEGAVSLTTTLAAPGEHNLLNAAASAACAHAAGAPADAIARGLAAFAPVKGRLQTHAVVVGGAKVALVDDSYNANPDSVRAAIDVLAAMPAPRLLVLGDMGEVGSRGPEFHAEVGAFARERGIQSLWAAGALCEHAARAFGAGARHFADTPAVVGTTRAGCHGAH
jgi:UDP-N-acetylmuramoyl-tripeptide--D-alanyl-D-alanine ligase